MRSGSNILSSRGACLGRRLRTHAVALEKIPLGKAIRHNHKQAELNERNPTDRDERGNRPFQKTQQYSCSQRPQRLAQSCQDGHHEALQLINPAGKDGERKERGNQRARGRSQCNADGEGKSQNGRSRICPSTPPRRDYRPPPGSLCQGECDTGTTPAPKR